jgi:hypothetical protein
MIFATEPSQKLLPWSGAYSAPERGKLLALSNQHSSSNAPKFERSLQPSISPFWEFSISQGK